MTIRSKSDASFKVNGGSSAFKNGLVPCILQAEESSKEYRKNWARLIEKISEVDPLTCSKCHGPMRIIAFIEDEEVSRKFSSTSVFGRSSTDPHLG